MLSKSMQETLDKMKVDTQEKLDQERESKCIDIFELSTGRYWERADELERDMTEQFLDYIELNGGRLPELERKG